MKGGLLKIVLRCGYVLEIKCSSYEMVMKSDGSIKRLDIEPIDKHQPSIIHIDTSEIALVTIER